MQTQQLEGLSEKIFLDRYAKKDADTRNTKVGDVVLVLTKDDPKFPTKQVGEVIERQGNEVKVKLRTGEVIDSDVTKLTLTIEKTPDEMWDRLAEAMASVEATPEKQQEWADKFKYILNDWKLVPGGRIAAGAGASDELTLFNCYVIPSPHDSRGGIMDTLTEMTEIMSRGGGVGINLSSLRPRRALVRGVNGSSSGAVSWGGLFSYTTGLIEQGGSRRGALMLMLNDWHPDLEHFITVKQTMGEITNANLSVCLSNAFMKAVKEDLDWELVFPDTADPDYDAIWDGDLDAWKKAGKKVIHYRTVKARDVWHTIIESAWKSAEPGVVFLERYNEMSNSWYFNPVIATNPCFHPDTRISTEFGLIRVEDLHKKMGSESFLTVTDDRLVSQVKVINGRAYEVPGVSLRQATVFPTGKKPTVKVQLTNGMELKVTRDHRIYTDKGWKEAKDLTADDVVYIQSGEGRFAEKDQLGQDWGHFLGWLTGDGWLAKRGDVGMVFGREDAEVVSKMIEIGKKLTGVEAKVYDRDDGTKQVYWSRKELQAQLRHIGVEPVKASEKEVEVPEAIFTATKETVKAYLQALFSADGTVYENDEMQRTVRLTSASKKLLQDVQQLLLNFGIHGKIYARPKSNQAEQRQDRDGSFYELILSRNNLVQFKEQVGFELLTRKQEALERIARPSQKSETFVSKVEKITDAEWVTVYDINEPETNSLVADGFVVHNCGEQGLPAWGVCNLSAINLSKFYDEERDDVDWDELRKVVRYSVRFLDNVIDRTPYHFEQNKQNQLSERRVGLGSMGLAELMIKLKIRYGSDQSLTFLDELYGFIAKEAYIASAEIASEKGSFKEFDEALFLQSGFMQEMVKTFPEVGAAIQKHGMRNVTVLTQAPTGSTGTMVGTSTGIEPYFAFEYFRQSRLGYDKQLVPIAQNWMDEHPGEELPDYFVTAMEMSADDHIRVQAAIQRWVDSSISKTANCPADFTVEETKKLYEYAFDLGCKGVTIYRDGSRDEQILSTTDKNEADRAENADAEAGAENAEVGLRAENANAGAESGSTSEAISVERVSEELDQLKQSLEVHIDSEEEKIFDKQYKSRPQMLEGSTYRFNTPLGTAYITINDMNGVPGELFLNVGKAGSDVFAMSEALGRVVSLFLRYGEHGQKERLLIKHLKGIGGSGAIGFGPNRVESIADAVAKALEIHLEKSEAKGSEHASAGVGTEAPAREVESNEHAKPGSTAHTGAKSYTYPVKSEGLKSEGLKSEDEAPPVNAVPQRIVPGSDEASSTDLCPSCGSASLIYSEGCKNCNHCGYSRC